MLTLLFAYKRSNDTLAFNFFFFFIFNFFTPFAWTSNIWREWRNKVTHKVKKENFRFSNVKKMETDTDVSRLKCFVSSLGCGSPQGSVFVSSANISLGLCVWWCYVLICFASSSFSFCLCISMTFGIFFFLFFVC